MSNYIGYTVNAGQQVYMRIELVGESLVTQFTAE
jgi:hypothetical protein